MTRTSRPIPLRRVSPVSKKPRIRPALLAQRPRASSNNDRTLTLDYAAFKVNSALVAVGILLVALGGLAASRSAGAELASPLTWLARQPHGLAASFTLAAVGAGLALFAPLLSSTISRRNAREIVVPGVALNEDGTYGRRP